MTTVLFTIVSFGIFAGGAQEAAEVEKPELSQMEIVVGALKGPSGFAAAGMLNDNFQPGYNVNAEYILAASPLELVTKMTSGEVDAAFLPVNTAAKLYTKGLGYKLVAVSGIGSLYMLSADRAVTDWA
ncbi:MAG TPA: hypothetical protein DCO79_07815, partial [Spirochaeta sp.]|nr:hypothetical protein [Spirochaeta sp.]